VLAAALQSTSHSAAVGNERSRIHLARSLQVRDQSVAGFYSPEIHRKEACACGGGCPPCAARSNDLRVSQPNDPAEIEADNIADRVLSAPADTPLKLNHHANGPAELAAKCDDCEEEEEEEPATLQRQERDTPGNPVSPGDDALPRNSFSSIANVINSGGSPLDRETRSFFEPRFGMDLSHVRIHIDSAAGESARAVNARAYTFGGNIVFGSGEYRPAHESGKRLLAHELAHVAQQNSANEQIHRTVVPAPTTFRSYAQLRQMRVPAFLAYIEQQADWFTNPLVTDNQRRRIRLILEFINEDVAAYFTYVGIWYFDQLLNDVTGAVSDENANALRAYASAASGRHLPFPVSNSPIAVTTAIDRGKDIVKLRRSFPDFVLHDALNETQFLRLRLNAGFLDDVIRYHDTAQHQPIFQAEDGADFESFISHNRATSRNPLRYESTVLLHKIRNFHRFQKPALDRLVTNFADHSHTKPVTLILHSTMDHNGAFHHDPNLTAVIRNNHMLTLMIEGFEHMSEYQSLISVLANDYGQRHGAHFLFDQVMFAGHGNAQTMGLAGTIRQDTGRPGHIEEVEEDLDVRPAHNAATQSLLREVLNFMANPANGTAGMSPRNRVVFNACLTGSNRVATAVSSGNPAVAGAEIQTFITTNPSLSTFLRNMADPGVTSIGSRASFGQVSLINAANQLDIISAEDRALTAAAPITYAERGIEPTGTLRSALEAWSLDRPATIAAMQRRVTQPATNWDKKLIKKAYQIILDPVNGYQNNGEGFRLVGLGVERIAEMALESSAHVANENFRFFQRLVLDGHDPDNSNLLSALTTTSEWANNAIQLALLQVWMNLDTTKQADFMTKLASLNCNFSVQFVDIGFLAQRGLMSTLLASAASTQAKLRLALIGMLGTNDDPAARTHLIGLLAGAQHFPAALNIATALGGATTEAALLIKLGVASAPTAQQVANVHVGGAGTNTLFVERLNVPGIVSNPFGEDVHEGPDEATPVRATLNPNDHVDVIGRTTDWYAIQFSAGGSAPSAAFISRFSVDLLSRYP